MNLDDLPHNLREICALIGLPATLKLVAARPGVRIYIPHDIDPGHWLADTVGLENARALCAARGGDSFLVPLMRLRREQIMIAEFVSGATDYDLALKYGCTEQTVRNIRKRHGVRPDDRRDTRQRALF